MLDCQLFIGFPLSKEYSAELELVDSSRRSFFIQDHPQYLQQFENEGVTYLGKSLGVSLCLKELDEQKEHLISLLKCLVPHLVYSTTSIKVISKHVV